MVGKTVSHDKVPDKLGGGIDVRFQNLRKRLMDKLDEERRLARGAEAHGE